MLFLASPQVRLIPYSLGTRRAIYVIRNETYHPALAPARHVICAQPVGRQPHVRLRVEGSLRECMAQFLYKWLNYYMCAHVQRRRRDSCGPSMSVYHSVFRVGKTQWVVLSVAATQNRVINSNAHGGPTRRLQQARDGRWRHASAA